MADVCDDLKARRGCGSGSRHEIFMKKHCKKTCGFCGMYNITRTRVVLIKSFEVRLNPSLFFSENGQPPGKTRLEEKREAIRVPLAYKAWNS